VTWIEAARGPLERLLDAEAEAGRESVRTRLEGLRLAYLDLRGAGGEAALAETPVLGQTRGTWVLWMLRKLLSPPAFETVRQSWRVGEALETGPLRDLAERITRADLRSFFDFWVFASHLPDIRLRRAEARGSDGDFSVTLWAENRGTGNCGAPLVVQTEEGARHAINAPVGPREPTVLTLSLVTRPVAVSVDPEGDLLMATGEREWLPLWLRKFWIF